MIFDARYPSRRSVKMFYEIFWVNWKRTNWTIGDTNLCTLKKRKKFKKKDKFIRNNKSIFNMRLIRKYQYRICHIIYLIIIVLCFFLHTNPTVVWHISPPPKKKIPDFISPPLKTKKRNRTCCLKYSNLC